MDHSSLIENKQNKKHMYAILGNKLHKRDMNNGHWTPYFALSGRMLVKWINVADVLWIGQRYFHFRTSRA